MTSNFVTAAGGLLRLQQGVITRPQALASGLTSKAIRARLASGRWQRLHRGVYATFSGEPPRSAWLWAAVLYAGPSAVLSHQTAGELYGLTDRPATLIHVTVPGGSPVIRPQGVMIHYSGRLEASRHPALAPPRTRLADSILDMACAAPVPDEAVSLVLRAIGGRRITAAQLAAAMRHRPRVRWRADLLEALGAAAGGAHSLLEFRYGNWVERPHGLPRGTRQRPVARGARREYQDIAYDSYLTVVELDGRSAHPGESRWLDIRRDNANAAHGLVTIRLSFQDVSQRPCASAAMVGSTLARRGWHGMPRSCGRGCPARGLSGR
jgi:hypothetical protein